MLVGLHGMSRGIFVLAGLLAVTLVLSYLTWTGKDTLARQEGITLVAGSPDDLGGLVWRADESEIELVALEDEHGRFLRVRVTEQVPGQEGFVPREGSEIPEPEEVFEERRVTFTGGSRAHTLTEALVPLIADRRLAGLSAERLETLGFGEDVRGSLNMTVRGTEQAFELGGQTHGGAARYLRLPGEQDVYLLNAGPLRPLERSGRGLMKRELHDFSRSDIESVVVASDGRRAEIVQREGEDGAARPFFADAADPDRRVEQYGNWIGKLLALRVREYVQEDELPEGLEQVASMEFKVAGSKLPVRMELFLLAGDDGEDRWYARSDHTRVLVSLPRQPAESVAADLDAVLP